MERRANVRRRGGSAQPTQVDTAAGGSASHRTPGAAGAGGKLPMVDGGFGGYSVSLESPQKKSMRWSGEMEQFMKGPWQEIKDGALAGMREKLETVETLGEFWDQRDAVGATPLLLAVLYSKSNCTPAEGGAKEKAPVTALANKVDNLEHKLDQVVKLLEASRGSAVAHAADTIQEGGRAGERAGEREGGREEREEERCGFNKRALGWEEKEEHDQIAMAIWKQEQLAHLRTEAYEGEQVSPRKHPL